MYFIQTIKYENVTPYNHNCYKIKCPSNNYLSIKTYEQSKVLNTLYSSLVVVTKSNLLLLDSHCLVNEVHMYHRRGSFIIEVF